MKILYLTEFYPPKTFGGGEIGAEVLAKNVSKYHEAVVLTSGFSELREVEKKNGVKIIRKLNTSPPGGFLNELKRSFSFGKSVQRELPKTIKEENPDIIHCLNTSSIDASTGVKTSVPKVATINSYRNLCPKANLFLNEKEECTGGRFEKCLPCMLNSNYFGKTEPNPLIKPFLTLPLYEIYRRRKNSLRKMDRLIAISSFVKKVLLHTNIPEEMITKIPNPMEINDGSNQSLDLPTEINVLSLSALEKVKGIEVLIKAMEEVENEDVKLQIAGEGSEENKLKNLTADLNLEETVNFLGRLPYKKVPDLYSKSDIVTIASKWPEPLSRVGTESLHFGKPLLATDVGGNRDLVEDGRNGFLIPPDPTEFSKKLNLLAEHKDLRKEMGRESRKIFEDKFKKDEIIKNIVDLYREEVNQID